MGELSSLLTEEGRGWEREVEAPTVIDAPLICFNLQVDTQTLDVISLMFSHALYC